MKYGENYLWPTPVLFEKIENREVLNSVINELLTNFDIENNSNNFQKFDILKEGGKVFQTFRKEVVEKHFENYLNKVHNMSLKNFKRYSLKSWLTGAFCNYTIPTHNHAGSSLSAVFYVFCEEQDKGGELMMFDPRTNANRGYINEFQSSFRAESFTPKTGDAVVFPSFLYHQTTPFLGKIRLAIPVDFFPDQYIN